MAVADAPLIEKLSLEQELQLERYYLDWNTLCRTEAADRLIVSAAIGRLYRYLKLEPPPVVFCQSPWQLVVVRTILKLLATGEGTTLRAALSQSLKKPLWVQAWQSIETQWHVLAPLLAVSSSVADDTPSTFLTKELFNDLGGPLQSVLKQSISQVDVPLDTPLCIKAKLQLRNLVQNRRQANRQEILRGNLFGGRGQLPPRLEQFLAGNQPTDATGLDLLMVQDFATEFLEQFDEQTRLQIENSASMVGQAGVPMPHLLAAASRMKTKSPIEMLFRISHEFIALLGGLDNLPTYGYVASSLPVKLESSLKQDIEDWLAIKKNLFHICCYDTLCLACERPGVAHFNDLGRLHCKTGAALEFNDGYKVYAVNGANVPRDIIEDPSSITVKRIDAENNVEIRRILVNFYGLDRYLNDSNAVQIDADDGGILYKKVLPNDEPIVVVKVKNTTADPDGSFKQYFLRVPPNITTVRAAVAWTFDMNSEAYRPTAES